MALKEMGKLQPAGLLFSDHHNAFSCAAYNAPRFVISWVCENCSRM
jgi:hypothetical protein